METSTETTSAGGPHASGMRILHVPQAYPPVMGGGEVLAQRVSEGLVARGHRVRVLTSSLLKMWAGREDGTGPNTPRVHQETLGGVQVERFPEHSRLHKYGHVFYTVPIPFRGKVRGLVKKRSFRAFARRVLETIERDDPDVVLTMMHNGQSIRAACAARSQRAFPLVVSPQLHHDEPHWPVDQIRAHLSHADAVTANTSHEAELLVLHYAVPKGRIVITGGGTDLPPEPGRWPRAPRVLFLGRKHPDKGLERLLEAMQLVWPACPDAELVIAGARTRHAAQIEAQIDALPAAWRRQVRSPDDISEEEKAELLSGARCLVLPSEYESFGLVLVEAWSHGTPVVTYDMPVFRSTVTPAVNGLLVPPRDTAALAAALRELLTSEALAQSYGTAGRDHVRRQHIWPHVAERYEAALRMAIRNAGTDPGQGAARL